MPRALAACLLLAAFVAGCGAGETVGGDEDADGAGRAPFSDETVTLVVPYSVGGGYDLYARMVAPHLERELDGARVVVRNEPGAGGLLAVNQLIRAAEDGTRVVLMNGVGTAGAVIAGAEGASFGLDDLAYIGRVAAEDHVLVVRAQGPWADLDEVVADGSFRFGSTGPGGGDFVVPTLLMAILGMDADIVTGFEGSAETELAVTRGDVDGMTGDIASRSGALQDGDHRPVLVVGPSPVAALPDVPALGEMQINGSGAELVGPTLDLLSVGRPLVVSGATSPERIEALRAAFDRAMLSDELREESTVTGRPLTPLSGEEIAAVVARLIDPPAGFRAALEDAY